MKDALLQFWNAHGSWLLVTAVIAIAGKYFAPGIKLLNERLHALIDAKVKNERVRGILDRLDDAAMVAAAALEQRVVSTLNPNVPLGANAKLVHDAAIAEMRTHLGQKGIDEAKEILGHDDVAIEKVLSGLIESKVLLINQSQEKTPISNKAPGGAA